jgi:hypothetical protein
MHQATKAYDTQTNKWIGWPVLDSRQGQGSSLDGRVETDSGGYPAYLKKAFSTETHRPARDAGGHLPPTNVEDKEVNGYTSIPPIYIYTYIIVYCGI